MIVTATIGKPVTSFHKPLESGAHYFQIKIGKVSGRVVINPHGVIIGRYSSKLAPFLEEHKDEVITAVRAHGAQWDKEYSIILG